MQHCAKKKNSFGYFVCLLQSQSPPVAQTVAHDSWIIPRGHVSLARVSVKCMNINVTSTLAYKMMTL